VASLTTVPLTPSLLLCIYLTFLSCLCSSPTGVINITAEPGQNVSLTCRATKNSEVEVVRLTRNKETVFLYRYNGTDKTGEHPEFKGRFSLQSLSTADGEVNVTLSNVTEKDNGTYLCDVKDKENNKETINHLHVDRQGESLWIRTSSIFLVLDAGSLVSCYHSICHTGVNVPPHFTIRSV
uniref:Ig-like domain-containing protein n=1 Tax=Cyprinodon variegatus TaxID=28743 RepID=A0A3Q2D686_CYPVA